MTTLAVLSDVHANTPALRAVLADVQARGADAVAYLGDIVFRGPDPGGSIELLASAGPVAWIRGNTDEWYLPDAGEREVGGYVAFGRSLLTRPQRAFLAQLPKQAVVPLDMTARVLCVHGSPRAQDENVRPDSALDGIMAGVAEDIVVCGHTHLPFLGGTGSTAVINAGSVGMSFDGDARASYALLSTSGDDVDAGIVRVPYDVAETVSLARAAGIPHLELYERAVTEGVPAFG